MKYSFFSVVLSLLLYINVNAGRSGSGYTPIYIPHSPSLQPHDGFVVLKNTGDTLYGNILLGEEKKGKDCVALTKPKEKKPMYIPIDSIDLVRLYTFDDLVVNTRYTDYRVLNNTNRLWRLIGKGKVDIYDNTLYCNENLGFTGDKLELADSSNLTKANLIRCMNKRYSTHFRRKDFKEAKDAMQYLVDRG